jgi:hypothetical protein
LCSPYRVFQLLHMLSPFASTGDGKVENRAAQEA